MQMNTDEVANNLLSVKNRFYTSLTDEEKEAFDLAVKYAIQMSRIQAIIEYQPAIQEDVFRYKSICKVLGEPTVGGNCTWTDILRDHIT